MHGAVKSAAPVGIRVGKGSTRLNGTHSEGCHHVKAKQLTAHQTLPALQFLTQLLGEELLTQNYHLVVHYLAPHFVQIRYHYARSQQIFQATHHSQLVDLKQHDQEKFH